MIWEQKFDEVDTFEAFYKNVIHCNGILIFPYSNVGVSYHPINPSKEHLHIDKAYIVCLNACINKINGDPTNNCKNYIAANFQTIGLSGVDLNKHMHVELEILCEKIFLQTLPESQLRKEFWIPEKTPNSESNMDKKEVEIFFNHEYMPDNIRELIK